MKETNMKETMSNMNVQQREAILGWLAEGDGHSVAPLDYFTDLGLPKEWLTPMVNRTWSNFVEVFDGITKVAKDTITGQPIGWLADKGRWVFLLTPKQQEDGYLDNNYGEWTKSRTKKVWVCLSDYDDWNGDVHDIECDERLHTAVKRQQQIHPDAEYWSHQLLSEEDARDWGMDTPAAMIEFKVGLMPEVNYDGKPMVHEVKSPYYFFVKYEGRKRADYFNPMRYVYSLRESQRRPLTMSEATTKVEKVLEEKPSIRGMFGTDTLNYRDDDNNIRPVHDIAKDMVRIDEKDIARNQRRVDSMRKEIPNIDEFVQIVDDKTFNIEDNPPAGWSLERLEPMGYTDVMWNGGYMTPWVDGVGISRVISALGHAIGADMSGNSMLGRGSSARYDGQCVIKHLEGTEWCSKELTITA